MKILVSGASGLVGSHLVPHLKNKGHDLHRLGRKAAAGAGEVPWNPAAGDLAAGSLEDFDAVVHLAGESIAGGRWTEAKKRRIRDSRVQGTGLLARKLAGLQARPIVCVCASAIGYYGDRKDEALAEDSGPGEGFLAEVCREWEEAARPAAEAGIRLVNLRIGIVLSSKGGALAKMLTPFRLGIGGMTGSGRQYMSWVALDDLVRIIDFAVATDDLSGPVNAVAPNPVTNAEFSRTLGRVLARPSLLPFPSIAAKLLLGEMAEELLLASARVQPKKLLEAGYGFRHPDLEGALRCALARQSH